MRFITVVLVVLLSTLSDPSLAKKSSEMKSGDKLRIASGGTVHTGSLISFDNEGFILLSPESSEEKTFLREDISMMERYLGMNSHWEIGALIGGGAALAYGLFCASQSSKASDEFWEAYTGEEHLEAQMVIITTAAGLVVGALIGSFFRDERWEEIPIVKDAELGFSQGHEGRYLTLSFSF